MSWKTEVETPKGSWASNGQRFATQKEAKDAGDELLSRWMVPISSRATETPEDPVTYRFNYARFKPEPIPQETITEKEAV